MQLVDPRERELPDAGLLTLHDPESGSWKYVDSSSPAVRDGFYLRMVEFDRELERAVRERGADLVRLETDQEYAEPLLAFFRRRERRP
jgi:hypothetical protein